MLDAAEVLEAFGVTAGAGDLPRPARRRRGGRRERRGESGGAGGGGGGWPPSD